MSHRRSSRNATDLELLSRFPKQRSPLPPEFRDVYVEHYRKNRLARGGLARMVASLEEWMHRTVAGRCTGGEILELGAGTLNHVAFEAGARRYDVVEPFAALWQDSPLRGRVDGLYRDIQEIPDGMRYDRILSIAVLEHLTDLPHVAGLCGRLLKEGGVFQAGIPTEGGLLWNLSWRMTTGIAFRITRGLNYSVLMKHEHVNTADEIEGVLGYLFEETSTSRFPVNLRHLSFYTYMEARRPRLDRCDQVLRHRPRPGVSENR